MAHLFTWTTITGEKHSSNEYPGPLETILELILTKSYEYDIHVRYHQSHPEHESAMLNLPPNLEILRIDNCRIRTWPTLPTTIREVYADGNDFFRIPNDMSKYTQLIVLQLKNGRLEEFITVLPPNIAYCDISSNALNTIQICNPIWPPTLTRINAELNPSRLRVDPNKFKCYIDTVSNAYTIQRGIFQPVNEIMRDEIIQQPVNRVNPRRVMQPTPVVKKTVYNNTQNVHDNGIQTSVAKNLIYISSYSRGLTSDEILDLFNTKTIVPSSCISKCIPKFISRLFCKKKEEDTNESNTQIVLRSDVNESNTQIVLRPDVLNELKIRLSQPYSMHGYHMHTIIDGLFARISAFESIELRKTAIQRFEEEVLDGQYHCTNGFMVRMTNVLVGLDENIKMQLNPSEILQARIPATMKSKREAGNWREGYEPWQWFRDCFVETAKDLDDCDVNASSEREKWLEPFFSRFIDDLIEGCNTQEDVTNRWKEWGLPNEGWAQSRILNNLKTGV